MGIHYTWCQCWQGEREVVGLGVCYHNIGEGDVARVDDLKRVVQHVTHIGLAVVVGVDQNRLWFQNSYARFGRNDQMRRGVVQIHCGIRFILHHCAIG